MNNESLLQTALRYHAAGFRVIPIGADKRPACRTWTPYREKQTIEDVKLLFSPMNAGAMDIGIITGIDGLEVIDIDTKHDPNKNIHVRYAEKLQSYDFDDTKLVVQKTRGGGYHFIYKADKIQGNSKLTKLKGTKEAVIETRGTGGYILVAPSQGYNFIYDRDLTDVKRLTDDERDELFCAAAELNEVEEPTQKYIKKEAAKVQQADGLTAWDDYNSQKLTIEVLQSYGWSYAYQRGDNIYMTRPGKNKGVSGAVRESDGLFFCFTSSVPEFEPSQGYSPFGVYAALNFNGDYSEAAKDLYSKGYGDRIETKNVPSVEVSKTETEVPKTDSITLETLKAFEFDPFEEYTAPDYLVKIHTDRGITNIGGKGCIITASGKHKSGKSFYASQFAVSALTRKICLGIEFDLRGKSVLYIDTEQPKFHFLKAQHFIRNQIQKLGGDANNYKALALRPLGKLERLEYVKAAFNIYKNLGLVIIDGLVDLINDYNDNKESSELLTTIMQLAEKSGAVIVQLLHVSKSTGRLRGHLGTEADNKSDCIIELAFDESTGLFNVSCKALRGSYPFASYEFIRDEKTGIPSLTNEDIDQQPPTYLRQANYDDFVKVVENNSNDFSDIPF